MRRALHAAAALAALSLAMPASAEWKPTKPITIIVPWAAGGSTDQVTRVTAGELEKALGGNVVVVNQPGASGSIGTKAALDAQKDGYTWTAGAAKDLGTYIVSGTLDTKIQDWHLYLNVANVEIFSVNPSSPLKDMGEFVKMMKENGDSLSVSTGGVNSSSFAAMEALKGAAGGTYKNVTYDGGNPAVIAAVSGEVMATSQLGAEQAEMIRAKKLRPLAVASDKPLVIEGYGEIPPITNWVKNYPVTANYFGIWAPKGIPAEVVQAMDKAWADHMSKSEALRKYAESKGAAVGAYYGEEAQKRVMPAVQVNAWQMFEGGKAKVKPDTVGIPKP
jgi:tripartite-type tricarboxylate transporter receptor subunit TctC